MHFFGGWRSLNQMRRSLIYSILHTGQTVIKPFVPRTSSSIIAQPTTFSTIVVKAVGLFNFCINSPPE